MFSFQNITKAFIKFSNNFGRGRRNFITSTYKDIEIPKETIAQFFFRYADFYPNNIAYVDDSRNISYTYSDTKRCVHGIASGLTKKGIKSGSIAGIIAANSPEYFMLVLALSSMGCSVTICNHNYTKTEMGYQMTDAKPSIIFTDANNLDKVLQAVSQIPPIQNIFLMGSRVPSFDCVDDLLEDNGDASPIGHVDIDTEEFIALMPYSSGTTGLPKGVMLTHKNLVSNMLQISTIHPIVSPETLLMVLPLYHIYATMIITTMGFLSGSKIIVQPKFDPLRFLKGIEKYKVSILHVVPPHILFFLNYPEVSKYDHSSVKKVLSAAAPLDAVVERRFIEQFKVHQPYFQVCQGYGLTETSPVTHFMPDHKYSNKPGSVGLMAPNMRCKIVDVSSRCELGPNQTGEILLQGPNVMKGYFGKSLDTEKAFENGWFMTGDIGHYDEDHYFYIADRIKELIKVKGLQVAPAEIEGLLLSHESICDCAVIGVPHEKFGEVPKAFIVKSKEITEAEIHKLVSDHLSPHKHLAGGIVFLDQIPKSPSGKILRRLLRDH